MAGCSPGTETRLSETWSCGRLAVGVRSSLILLQRNCSRLWCLPSRSSTCGSLRQAVAFREHAEPSCGPGEPAERLWELGRRRGGRGLGTSSVCFFLYLLRCWCGIFWKLSLSSPGTDKSSALFLLPGTRWVWGGRIWLKRWVTTYSETDKPSCYTPQRFAVGHTHTQKKKGFKAFLHSGWLQRKAHPRWKTEGFQILTCNLIERAEEYLLTHALG